MPWKVAHARYIQVEADRIQAIIEMPRYWNRTWTSKSLRDELGNTQHLVYSVPEVEELNDELHTRGVVEDQGPPPPPVP